MHPLYQIEGIVTAGKKRGKKLGFPTANLVGEKNIPEGIYASKVVYGNKEYLAAVFVGTAQTFGEDNYLVECYILDFAENIYNKKLEVALFYKIRESKKFASAAELIKQIERDVKKVRKYFV